MIELESLFSELGEHPDLALILIHTVGIDAVDTRHLSAVRRSGTAISIAEPIQAFSDKPRICNPGYGSYAMEVSQIVHPTRVSYHGL